MALPLPNGETQFIDANGNPLVGGFVYHYVPGTSTPKNTYQDSAGTIVNSNPIVLDSAGRAIIWGDGSYRQIVTDSLGVQQYDQETAVATLTGLGAVAKAGDTMTGNLTVPGLTVAGAETIPITLTANPQPSYGSLNVYATTTNKTTCEVLAAFGLTSTLGNGLGGGAQNRVALYSGLSMQSGSGDAWSLNTVLNMEVGATATANALGYELDFNNLAGHRGDTAGGGGLAAPVAYPLAVTGVGNYRSTAAMLVAGPGGAAVWNRGIVLTNASISQVTFQDYTSSTTTLEINSAHTYGIDTNGATFTGAAMRLGNGQYIKARDGGGANDLSVLVQSGANLILGDASTTAIYSRNVFAPFTDNAVTCGANGNRWSAVWAANGTIQTSDPREKTDIAPLSGVPTGSILDAIEPISFRWIDGGFDEVEEDAEVERPVTEISEWSEQVTEMRDGVPTLVTVKHQERVPVYEEAPAFNSDGTPAFIVTEGKPAIYDRTGQLIREAIPEMRTRAMHRAVKTERVTEKVKRLVPREGRRTHWGFDASQVEQVSKIAGRDFGGFVRSEDGTLAIRPDQFVPILWEEVRRLRERVAGLEAR